LNKKASELMQEFEVHSCTDITGFGFIGHTYQLAQNSQIGIRIDSSLMPFFEEAKDFAQKGFRPGGLQRNRDFYNSSVEFTAQVPEYMNDILFDPQTSGGLLIVVAPEAAVALLGKLRKAGITDAATVGEIIGKPVGKLIVE